MSTTNPLPVQEQPFSELAADLPEKQKAEFYQNLHETGISPKDVELARLLRALQLYKAYYESIPEAVKAAASQIERLRDDTQRSSDASAQLTCQLLREAEHFRDELAKAHDHIAESLAKSTEGLASRVIGVLEVGIEKTVFEPLKNRILELAQSNAGFTEAITRTNRATEALRKSADQARRVHLWVYALCGALIVFCLSLCSWLYLHQWYAGQIEQERSALVGQVAQNRALLLELAKSHRTLELRQDPQNPHRKLLVMKDASGWQSRGNQGVIEFYQ